MNENIKTNKIFANPIGSKTCKPINFGALGKEIKISPKSRITINESGYKVEYFVETVSIIIGIGKDYIAELIMDKEAWEALNNNEEINITTLKEFKGKFL